MWCSVYESKILQDVLRCVGAHVDAAHEARRSQLLTTEPTPLDGALREVVVSDGHARLARCLCDRVAFATACGARESKGAGLIVAKEGNYLRHCHGSRAERVMQLTVPWSRLFYLTQVARAASERTSLQLDERLSPGFSDDVDYNTRPGSIISPLAAFSPFSSFSYNLLRSRGYRADHRPGEVDGSRNMKKGRKPLGPL